MILASSRLVKRGGLLPAIRDELIANTSGTQTYQGNLIYMNFRYI
jgi:hypothetical protein